MVITITSRLLVRRLRAVPEQPTDLVGDFFTNTVEHVLIPGGQSACSTGQRETLPRPRREQDK
jgi:hypothetical protein